HDRSAPAVAGLHRRLGTRQRGPRFRRRPRAARPPRRVARRSQGGRSGRRTAPRPQVDPREVSAMNVEQEKGFFTEENSADVVISRNAAAKNERLKQVMAVVTRKLHEAVKEIEPTQDEWFEAIMFLTNT